LRKLDEAQKDLDKAVKVDPKYAMGFVDRANYLNVAGKPARALADSDIALKLNPKLPLSYYKRAGAALNLKQYDRAIAEYSEVLKLRPQSAIDIYKLRGHAYSRKGDNKHATADYDAALKLAPEDADTLLNRGARLERTQGKRQGASRLQCGDQTRAKASARLCRPYADLERHGRP
jgi:tetratricopeptide (TPR) repeat protein